MDNDDRIQLLKLHPTAEGLDDIAVKEIADAAEVVRLKAGEIVFQVDQALTSVFLLIHGRLRLQILDLQGRIIVERFQGPGGQVGALAAALAEPQPFVCRAEDPSVLLRMDYETALDFARKYPRFRENYVWLMADSVRQSLLRDKLPTQPQIVAFFHASDQTRSVSHQVMERLVQLGEVPHLVTDRGRKVRGVQSHVVSGDWQSWSPEAIRQQSAVWLQSGRIVFDVDMRIDPALAIRALDACEQIYWCVTPEECDRAVADLRHVVPRGSNWRDKVRVVWLVSPGERPPLIPELAELARSDIKITFGQPDMTWGPAVFNGIERLVHLLRGVRIGVALGGGAARGMAHLGVLKALEQSGIVIDMIAGTSAGAMTGTIYSAGYSPDFLAEHFAADLRPSRWFRMLPRGEQWYLLYKYRFGHFDPMLRKYLGHLQLEQACLPMFTVTVDLIGGKEVVRYRGDAVHSILESINLPLLAPPINRAGEALVDGGLINNVPANVLAARGCNFVIAVSVTAKMEQEFARNRADTPQALMRRGSAIQTLLRSFLVQSHNVNAVGVQSADCMIEPDVTAFQLTAFARTRELTAVGEQATLAAIPGIKAQLQRLDPKLFS